MSCTVDMAAAGGKYEPRAAAWVWLGTGVRKGLGGWDPKVLTCSVDEWLEGGYAPAPDSR
jgi:hypothetical protein